MLFPDHEQPSTFVGRELTNLTNQLLKRYVDVLDRVHILTILYDGNEKKRILFAADVSNPDKL